MVAPVAIDDRDRVRASCGSSRARGRMVEGRRHGNRDDGRRRRRVSGSQKRVCFFFVPQRRRDIVLDDVLARPHKRVH